MRDNKGRFIKGSNEMLGRHHTDETKKKLRLQHLGKPLSSEHKKSISDAQKGKPNRGQFKKGFIPKNKGESKYGELEGDKECSVCHKVFHYKRSQFNPAPKTCSKECRYESAGINQRGIERPQSQGEKSYLWRGGITTLYNKIRGCLKYDIYRKSCFKRDNYICQICKKRGSLEINMDHIISFARIIDFYQIKTFEEALNCNKLWDLDNVRTLCYKCHSKTPTYMVSLDKHPTF